MADSITPQIEEPQAKRKRDEEKQEGNSPKRTQTNYSDIVTILVGKKKVPFVVHREILCYRSPYFAAACSQEWLRDSDKTIAMGSIKSKVFTKYLDWVYKGTIESGLPPRPPPLVSKPKDPVPLIEDKDGLGFKRAYGLYIAADVLLDGALKNSIIDQILLFIAYGALEISPENIQDVWENTAEKAKLRLFILDYLGAHKTTSKWLQDVKACIPPEFWVDLGIQMTSNISDGTGTLMPAYRDRCHYHDHGKDEAAQAACRSATKTWLALDAQVKNHAQA